MSNGLSPDFLVNLNLDDKGSLQTTLSRLTQIDQAITKIRQNVAKAGDDLKKEMQLEERNLLRERGQTLQAARLSVGKSIETTQGIPDKQLLNKQFEAFFNKLKNPFVNLEETLRKFQLSLKEQETRQKRLTAIRGVQDINGFVEARKRNPQEILETIKLLRREASKGFARGISPELAGQDAKMANDLAAALKSLQPATKTLNRLVTGLNNSPSSTLGDLRGKPREEIDALSKSMAQAYRKAARSDSADKDGLLSAKKLLDQFIYQLDNPTRNARLSGLNQVAGLRGDALSQSMASLTTGKSQAALEQLLTDAKSQYRKTNALTGDAEGWRQVQEELKRAIKLAQGEPGTGKGRPLNARQERQQLEAERIGQYSQSRYTAPQMAGNYAQMGIGNLQGMLDNGKLRLQAQQLRVEKALSDGKGVAEEERALRILQAQLREMTDQLNIKRQIERQNAKNNSAEVKALNEQRARDRFNAQNSPQALDANIRRQLATNQRRRELDNGADMFQNQAMLLRNYAIMGAGVGSAYSTGSFIVQLDKGFKQLQSILALTNNDMVKLKGEIIEISELTKFDAVEVVDTAVILGQAGLSKEQITKSLEGITLFATAIGTDLKSAVDLATSALGVFNIESSRMPEVVDKLTISINRSKLNLDKLSLGLQYAGNIAEQSNVSFEETVASLAAMANSGIKSGSTLGTGLRQILITLQKPSEAFRQKVKDLGLEMSDLDINTNSLIDVMERLHNAGFTVVDAMQTMEVRTASAFSAFSNNIGKAREITKAMEGSGAASEANAVQMEALANQWARFASIAKSIFYEALKPLVEMMTTIITKTGDWLSALKEVGGIVNAIIAGFVTIQGFRIFQGAGALLGRIANGKKLVGGKDNSPGTPSPAVGAAEAGAAGAVAVMTSTAARSAIMGIVLKLLGGPVAWGAGLAAMGVSYAMYASKQNDRVDDEMDRARFESGQIRSRQEVTSTGLASVGGLMQEAYSRRSLLESSEKDMSAFVKRLNTELKNLGFYMDDTTPAFDKVIEKLKAFRGELTDLASLDISRAAVAAQNEAFVGRKQLAQREGETRFTQKSGSFGAGTEYYFDQRALARLNPDIARLLDRKNTEGVLGYRSKFSSINAETSTAELQGLRSESNLISSQVQDFLLKNSIPEIMSSSGVGEERAQLLRDELEKLVNELKSDSDALGNILGKDDQVETAEVQKALTQASEDLRSAFEDEVFNLIAKYADARRSISQAELGDLEKYQALKDLDAKGRAELQQLNDRVRVKADSIANNYGLDPEKYRGDILNNGSDGNGIPSFLLPIAANNTEALRESSRPALKDLRRRNLAEINAQTAELEYQELRRAESMSEKDLLEIAATIRGITEKINALDTEIKVMEADVSDNPQQKAEVAASQQENLDSQKDAQALRDAQALVRVQYLNNFKAGNFDVSDASRTNDKAIAMAMRDFFKEYQKLNQAELRGQMTLAQGQRLNAEALGEKSQLASQAAGDSGLLDMDRNLAVANAIKSLRASVQAFVQAIETEQGALQTVITKDETMLEALKQNLENVDQFSDKGRQIADQIGLLTSQIDGNQKRVAELEREKQKPVREERVKSEELLGKAKLNYYDERRFMSQSSRQYGAQINGGFYQSNAQVAAGAGEGTQLGFADNGTLDKAGRGLQLAVDEAYKSYENFDGFVAMAEGLKTTLESLSESAADFFTQWATGAMRASDAFRGFTISLLQSLTKMAMQIATNQIMEMILGAFAGSTTTTSTGGGANLTGTAMWTGGLVGAPKRYASGGLIAGGMKTRDSTLINAAQGEYVLRSAAVKAIGLDNVDYLNSLDESSVRSMKDIKKPEKPEPEGDKVVNVWVVHESEQPQGMDENGVLVVVNKALMRDSTTKKLVKQINMGGR